jgi:two-component system, OmpR family, sensor histidine kinase QseC
MMLSLRARLLVALLATVLVFWGALLVGTFVYYTRDQTGEIDATLREIAASILLSTQANLDALPEAEKLQLPEGASYAGDIVSYQTWLRSGKNIWRSPGAPPVPFRADFADGFADRTVEGTAWRVFALSDAAGRFQVQVGKRQSQIDAALRNKITMMLGAGLIMFALLVAVIWSVVRWSLQPVTEVRSAVQRRRAFDFAPLPAANLPAEVRPLVESFNTLLGELDLAVQHERRFISDAAHELRTPLAALLAHSEVALRAERPQEKNAALLRLSSAVQRAARLCEQMLDLARLDAGASTDRRSRVCLHELLAVVVRDFATLAQRKRQLISLEVDPCTVHGDVDELGILARNLIDNALRYTGEGGRVAVCTRYAEKDAKRAVCLSVADNGPGVPEDERERIFTRFYRVAGNGARGAGIGLSLVARIAQSHGAGLEVGAGLEARGLSVAVWFDALPGASPLPAGASPAPDRAARARPRPQIPHPTSRRGEIA